MKLQEIFDGLTSGELSQLSIGHQGAGIVNESNWGSLVPHINLALTKLYSRFLLKEGRLTIELVPDRTVYPLKSQYAVANPRSHELVKFILDEPAAPFKDDIVKIVRVVAESNQDLALNDAADPLAVTTTTATTLVIPSQIVQQTSDLPDWLKGDTLQVVYRAGAPKIAVSEGFFDPSRVEVPLPDTHMVALLYFVASRVTSPMGSGQFEGVAGNNWYARYEAECQQLENQGLQEQRQAGYDRFSDRGFV